MMFNGCTMGQNAFGGQNGYINSIWFTNQKHKNNIKLNRFQNFETSLPK